MKRKVLLLNLALAGITTLGVAAIIAGTRGNVQGQLAGDSTVWNHYQGVENTISTKGIKEYWVNCGTHETVFAKPAGTVNEAGTPTRAFIDSLDSTDDRLIPAGGYRISFENASDVNYIINGNRGCIGSKVIETSGTTVASTHQNSYLKIQTTASTTFSCTFLGTYLANVFSDSSVTALNFDMKCSVAGVTKLSYGNAVKKCYEYDCTTDDQPGFGLQNTWKTFSLTRAMYDENLNNNGNLICTVGGQVPVGSYIYLDNIHPVTSPLTCYSFDSGRAVPASTDPTSWYGYVGSYRDNTNKEIFTVSTIQGTAIDFTIDDAVANDGPRAAKFHRTSNKNLWVRLPNVTMADVLAVVLDIRVNTTLNANNNVHTVGTGNGSGLFDNTTGQLKKDTWHTVTIPATKFDGNCIISMSGSPDFTCYIDNVRIVAA